MATTFDAAATQRRMALNRANLIRGERAKLKREIRSLPPLEAAGVLADVIESPSELMLSCPVFDALMWLPGRGKNKVRKLLFRAGTPESKPLGMLSARQRDEIVTALRGIR